MHRSIPLIFVLFALMLTWPLVGALATHIPLGSESSGTVPFFNLWTVGWNAQRAADGWRGYWDAPIFYPSRGALSFSDPQPLTGPVALTIWQISPALAYNLILLTYLSMNGLAGYLLARVHHAGRLTAVLTGVLLQALPFVTHERGVLQLQPIFGPLLALAALWRLLERPSWRPALALGLALSATFLTSEYYFLFLIPVLVLQTAVNLPSLRRPAAWRMLALAGGIVLALSLPIALRQASYLRAMGFTRSEASIVRTAAHPLDYVRISPQLRLSARIQGSMAGSGQRLYPGTMLVVLAVTGGVVLLRRDNRSRRWGAAIVATAVLALAWSVGPRLELGGFRPFGWLYAAAPGLGWVRSPFRAAVFAQAALGLLAAGSLSALGRRWRLMPVLLVTLALIEVWPKPETLLKVPELDPTWSRTARTVGAQVVAHLPWAESRSASAFEDTATWMLQSLGTGTRSVNGYSGFFPATNSQLRHLTESFPSRSSLRALQAMGVDLIVHHGPLATAVRQELAVLQQEGLIGALIEGDREYLVTIVPTSNPASSYSGPWSLAVVASGQSLQVRALAIPPAAETFLYDYWATRLPMELMVEGSGQRWLTPFRPAGTALLFRGSGTRINQTWGLQLAPGRYHVILRLTTSADPIASSELEIDR